jgi:tetraacyldisaccharide-1-P 4'-kinase
LSPTQTHQVDAARVVPTPAVLVGVDFGPGSSFDPTLDELALLAQSAGDEPVARIIARRKAPDAALFVGSGKADEIKAAVQTHQAQGVIFDQALSPVQQRNLERHLGVAVADRTALENFSSGLTLIPCHSSGHTQSLRMGWPAQSSGRKMRRKSL